MPAIISSQTDRVATITLNKPEKLNAWDRSMREDLIKALAAANADSAVGAIVLTGAGERAFCAGQDLSEARSFDGARGAEWVKEWQQLYNALLSCEKPVVAALNGLAVGSAFQFALLCDFRIAHGEVVMGQPEINSGITSTTGPWIMREILGIARTIDLTLTGRLMKADECLSMGLITKIVDKDKVMPAATELAATLATKPPVAMRLNKRWLREMVQASFDAAISAGLRNQQESFASGEPSEMIRIFFEERRA